MKCQIRAVHSRRRTVRALCQHRRVLTLQPAEQALCRSSCYRYTNTADDASSGGDGSVSGAAAICALQCALH
jgi:hypothetical protein